MVVIGSGATAATIVELSKAKHVTMLQRSPTYYFPSPDEDRFANFLKKFYTKMSSLVRLRNVFQQLLYRICRSYPKYVKRKHRWS